MPDQDIQPAQGQPAVPQPTVPPVAAQPIPRRRGGAWMWWTIGIVVALALLVGSCTMPFTLLLKGDGFSGKGLGGDAIAVLYIDGVIAGTGDGYSGYVTPESFKDKLDQAEQDDSVKAIVLRVDSPGGTAAASEEIARYVKNATKPVVVSVGDVDASGAYMVSSQADEIWAMPAAAVGSIGVISEIPNVSGLLDKLGVRFQVITAGKYKDAGSPYRPLTKEERALIQGEVDDIADQFVGIVAEGRKMKRSEVQSLATGWAWNGSQAKELGLVDRIGTLDDALESAADKGGIDGDYDVVTYEKDDLESVLGGLLGVTSRLGGSSTLDQMRGAAARSALPQ